MPTDKPNRTTDVSDYWGDIMVILTNVCGNKEWEFYLTAEGPMDEPPDVVCVVFQNGADLELSPLAIRRMEELIGMPLWRIIAYKDTPNHMRLVFSEIES